MAVRSGPKAFAGIIFSLVGEGATQTLMGRAQKGMSQVVIKKNGVVLATVTPSATGAFTYALTGLALNDTVSVEPIFSAAATPLFPVGPAVQEFIDNVVAGTSLLSFTNLASGEKIVSFTPNDGRVVLNSAGTQLLRGLSAVTAGTVAVTARTSRGRNVSLNLTITPAAQARTLWTPALLPAAQMPYALTIQNGALKNAAGTAVTLGPVAPAYVASGPRGLPAMDFGVSGSSITSAGPNVGAGYWLIADLDSYSMTADSTVARRMADYGQLWNGNLTGTGSRPALFLKHVGFSGRPFVTAGSDAPVGTAAFPTESPIAMLARFNADGTGYLDINGDRSSLYTCGTAGISNGILLGSPGTQDFEGARSMIRGVWIFTGNEADALRFQGWLAWKNGYQRQLHPAHPYRAGPPLADGTARTALVRPGLSRNRSVYVGYASPSEATKWAAAMSRSVPALANDHGDYSSWSAMLSSGNNLMNVWAAAGYTGIVATIPLTVTGVSLSASAAGSGDTETTALVNGYKTKFSGRRVYRLGHEPNVARFPWCPAYSGAGTAADFLSAWARKAAVIRAADPSALIAWNPAAGNNNFPWTSLVPPGAQFDLVHIDAYNMSKGPDFDAMTGWTRFMANVLNTNLLGLDQLIRLAEQLGKPWGLAEYGTGCGVPGSNSTAPQAQGGDDPLYPEFMAATMRGGTGTWAGYAEQPCVDDCPYEITDSDYSSRTYNSSPPQASAPSDARDTKPSAAAAFKRALADTALARGLPILSAAPVIAFHIRPLATSYTGAAIRLARVSDGVQADIPFTAGGHIDMAAVRTFAGTQILSHGVLTAITSYDATGGGNHITWSTGTAAVPFVSEMDAYGPNFRDRGVVAVASQKYSFTGITAVQRFGTFSNLTINAQNVALFGVVAPMQSQARNAIMTVGASTGANRLTVFVEGGGQPQGLGSLGTTGGAAGTATSAPFSMLPRNGAQVISVVSRAGAGKTIRVEDRAYVGASIEDSRTLTGGGIGITGAGNTYFLDADFFGLTVYPSSISEYEVSLVHKAMSQHFDTARRPTGIFVVGSSTPEGQGATNNRSYPRLMAGLLNQSVDVWNGAIAGQTLASAASTAADRIWLALAEYALPILLIDGAANDFLSGSTSSQVYTTAKNFIAAFRTAFPAGKVVMVTPTGKSSATQSQNDNRLAYCVSVRNNKTDLGYDVLVDRAAIPQAQTLTDTVYFRQEPDGSFLHATDVLHLIYAQAAATGVQTLLPAL